MAGSTQRGRTIRKILFVCALALIFLSVGLAVFMRRPWIIPEYEKKRVNPLTPSEAVIKAAKPMFSEHCANCHGDTGKGDGADAMMYDPAPTDLTDAALMAKLTDGAIFYQITQGRKPMPSFRKRFTEEQRWQLVILVRSLAAPASVPAPTQNPAGNSEPKSNTPAQKK
jgi:mono/diheme cytochrome c family protein